MKIVELTNYSFISKKTGQPFKPFNFFMTSGDVFSVSTDSSRDALSFLKSLATLTYPVQGAYRYKQRLLDFSSYRNLLQVKKNIGFITAHSTLISNRTVRENLLLMNAYHTNSLSNKLDQRTQELCHLFSLEDKLDVRPATLTETEYRLAVTIRELIKAPEILLLQYPEKYVGIAHLSKFNDIVFDMLGGELCMVFLSEYQKFIETFSKKKLVISKGALQEVTVGDAGQWVGG